MERKSENELMVNEIGVSWIEMNINRNSKLINELYRNGRSLFVKYEIKVIK
jgi:hypothetical protein